MDLITCEVPYLLIPLQIQIRNLVVHLQWVHGVVRQDHCRSLLWKPYERVAELLDASSDREKSRGTPHDVRLDSFTSERPNEGLQHFARFGCAVCSRERQHLSVLDAVGKAVGTPLADQVCSAARIKDPPGFD